MSAARIETIPLAGSFLGGRREVAVFRYGTPGSRPKIYLQAALHAGEMTGTMALHHLRRRLESAELAGRIRGEIVVVPVANPIGMGQFLAGDHFGRFETGSLCNFNREHFDVSEAVAARLEGLLGDDPEANVATIRSVASAVIDEIEETDEWRSLRKHLLRLSIDADVCLDLHSDMSAVMFMYINGFDWPGLADLAADIGCEAVVHLTPYVPSKTFAGVVGALWPRLAERFPVRPVPNACATAMIEMRGRHACSDGLGAADADGFVAFLTRRGAIAGEPPPLPPLKTQSIDVEGMDVGYAPSPGFVTYERAAGDRVSPGDVVCHVIDPTTPEADGGRVAVCARQEGVIYARSLDGFVVTPGKVLFRIAGAEPLAHRRGRSWLDD
ncbi:succinylglutamate desuccinylase/aspartoacylase family protein [Prosthecomicrobium sp. N25]|uniref:succinylglutamate desuccinylase/aspartoacylase family protein n=1 Tax=Prosthecomicrobium sp. N25 TaxID=3129254 RepID=UPI0030768A66